MALLLLLRIGRNSSTHVRKSLLLGGSVCDWDRPSSSALSLCRRFLVGVVQPSDKETTKMLTGPFSTAISSVQGFHSPITNIKLSRRHVYIDSTSHNEPIRPLHYIVYGIIIIIGSLFMRRQAIDFVLEKESEMVAIERVAEEIDARSDQKTIVVFRPKFVPMPSEAEQRKDDGPVSASILGEKMEKFDAIDFLKVMNPINLFKILSGKSEGKRTFFVYFEPNSEKRSPLQRWRARGAPNLRFDFIGDDEELKNYLNPNGDWDSNTDLELVVDRFPSGRELALAVYFCVLCAIAAPQIRKLVALVRHRREQFVAISRR